MRSLSKSKWMEAVQSYVLYFFFYSMLGWLYEVFLEVVVYRWGFTNRGVLVMSSGCAPLSSSNFASP